VPSNEAATTSASTLDQGNATTTAQEMQGATVDTTKLLAQVDALQHQVDALQTQVSALKNHVHSFQVLDPSPWGIENMADLKLWMFDKQYALTSAG
jgi:hypothetical protein